MDEMEQLCGRIAIMAGGELCALGSAAELRAAHAQGHTLTLKLRPSSLATDYPDHAETELSRLKTALHSELECCLKEEHESLLSYHLPPAAGDAYSIMFGKLERLRAEHAVLEDYSLNETTLEEVFLAFARDAARSRTRPSVSALNPV
ncbi:ATP-binding cassette sub-family A member 7 [Eumeta japonica]|uniref:ATP-binding cassette sub-family A member 7 n=1 Tax=Eumeta variegata TaxID=151549 RepID=A0A4C1XHC6_EUMVA|nr:ATP-binding cassette sub-family A member 7 [Eumeta japonica]